MLVVGRRVAVRTLSSLRASARSGLLLWWITVDRALRRRLAVPREASPYGLLGSIYGARLASAMASLVVTTSRHRVVVRPRNLGDPGARRSIDPIVSLTAGALFAFYVTAWTLPAFNTIETPVYFGTLSVPLALLAHHALVRAADAGPNRVFCLRSASRSAVPLRWQRCQSARCKSAGDGVAGRPAWCRVEQLLPWVRPGVLIAGVCATR